LLKAVADPGTISYQVPVEQELIMNEYDDQKGAKPEDVRAALKGWAFFAVITSIVFGVAYALIEM
jgi:hypothetical protein